MNNPAANAETTLPDMAVTSNDQRCSHEIDEICEEVERGNCSSDKTIETTTNDDAKDPAVRQQTLALFQPIDSSVDEGSERDLVNFLRASLGNESNLNPRLRRRIRDFNFAQGERAKRYPLLPYGIVLLFDTLSGIRADLRWAEDAAWRRENGKPYVSCADFESKRFRRRQRPYLTYMLILSHTAMMIWAFKVNNWKMESMDVNPLAGPSATTLLKLGALNTQEMVENGAWYRLVTATFLHAGLIHLIMNTFMLALLGKAIELNHGMLPMFFLFFIPAVGGNVMSAVLQPGTVSVGASGGIFGLLGGCLADSILNWNLMFLVFKDRPGVSRLCMKIRCIALLSIDLFFQALIGFMPYVDNFVHLGGLIYGCLAGFLILERLPLSFFGQRKGCCQHFRILSFQFFSAVLLAFFLVLSSIWLSQSDGVTSPCPSCRYISCAPFPFWTGEKWWYCDNCDSVRAELYYNDDRTFYTEIEVYCPDGGNAFGDISEYAYTDLGWDRVQEDLAGFCRRLC